MKSIFYNKSYEIEEKNSLEKKKYEYLNEYGYNIDCNNRKRIDVDLQIKKHKNS